MKVKLLFLFTLLLTAVSGAWADSYLYHSNNIQAITPVASGNSGDLTWQVVGEEGNYILYISGTGAISSNPWYNYRADITSVVINNGVTGINSSVFMNTTNLKSVSIPASVSYIGQQVFDGCTNLETVSGCEGVTDVGDKAFSGTKWLTDQPDGVVYIGKVAYLGKNVSGEVNIKASTVSISNNAFKDCTNLTSITIPNSVTYIGSYTFYGCTGLISIEIPNSVTSIGSSAFEGCTNLISIEIPNSVTSIGSSAFQGCTSLTSITIPDDVTNICESTFQGCTSLTSITIPNGVTDIGSYTFYGCTGLTSITIPNGVTEIYESTFQGCTSLTSITIPNSVTYIGAKAFFGCSILATVTIGSGVESIGGSAFKDCTNLETVTVYAQDCSLGNNAFNYCSKLANIYVFSDLVDHYKSLPNWSNYRSIIKGMTGGYCGASGHESEVVWVLAGTSPNYTLTISGTGAMADYSLTNRPWVNYLDGIVTVVIEDGVESIGSDAFRNCTSLESVTIPASVTSIGASAFQKCSSLTSISIPASVTSIGGNAFYDTGLTSITIPASVTSIGTSAFYGCKLTSITLSEGLTTISAKAFSNNGTTIERVSIPQSVTSIGNWAFNGTSVQHFYINNVPSVLAIGENSPFELSGVTIHVYTQMKSIFENATNWSKYKGHFVGDIDFTSVTSVTLDNESMIVKTNASGKLNATINPAGASVKNIVFTSSNDNIVHITDAATGEFLAGSQEGTATITCTAMDGSGAYATCNVEVNNYLTPAESVTLNKTTNSLEVGDQFNLTATIAPGNVTYKNIIWRSSDNNVATVTNGTVTAVAPGVATITAISQDGQARANCVVSVIGSCGTDVTWVLTGTSPNYTLTISGTGAMSTKPWSSYKNDITTVVINNGVTDINFGVFMNTPNLTSVTIPASVSYIGQQVFDGCTNLETVSGCEGVTDVGDDAFSGTKWLTDQPDGVIYIGKVAYLGKNVSGEVNIKAGTVSISSDAFNDCTNLTSITIPNSVTYIGYSAFEGCTNLISIEIPNSVTYIGSSAFKGCTNLTSITIPNGVKEIYESTFLFCTSLTSVTIPSSLERIGEAAFYNSGLTSITIPNSVMYIGANAFAFCSNLETVTVYAPNCSLGNNAFNSCHEDLQIYVFSDYLNSYKTKWNKYETKITAITPDYSGDCGKDDPQDVTWQLVEEDSHYTLYISGTGAMQDADQAHSYKMPWEDKVNKSTITNVIIGDGVTSIGSSAFSGCTGLTSVTIPASVTSIGDHAFDGCTHLTTIGIPASVTSIGNGAFNGCSILEKVTIYATSVPTLGTDVFTDNKTGRKIYVFSNCVTAYKAAWSTYTNDIEAITPDYSGDCGKTNSDNVKWQLAGDNDHYTLYISGTGAMADYASENNKPWYYYSLNITSVLIEDGVTSIGNNAFKNCVDMMSVTIPNSVTSIGEYAFYRCNIKSVTIPASVESLCNKAFKSCSNLATVYLQRCTTPITTLGTEAFDNCNKLAKIYVLSDLVDTYKAATNWSAYESKIVGAYTVTFGTLPDGVSGVAPSMAAEGETVTVSFSGVPAGKAPVVSGTYNSATYGQQALIITDNGDGTYSFTMGDGPATITVSELKKDFKSCTVTVPNPIYHSSYTHSYFYDGTWNDNHGGIVVYDGETLLTYYHYDSEIEGFVGDYRFSMLESLDGGNCENLNEHCRVYLEGMGAYAGTLYKDVEIVPATVTNAKWGDLTWNLDASGNFTITGTGAMKSADTFRNYDWYNYSSYFTSITIGNGITTVAAAAFGGNSNTNPYASVTSVSLPESLTTIGESAFAYCTRASFNADDLIAQGVTYGENSFNQVGCLVGTLANNADNTEKIALLYQARRANVTLSDRTLYKDGAWNTIVLPFDIADINAKEEEVYTCPLHGATVMELNVDNKWAMVNSEWAIDNVNGTMQTGLVDGTLNLFFKPATSIESGKPYIIKWASGSNLENPVFNSVPVFVDNHNATSSDGKVVFKGTYGPVTWNTETKSILFLGDENKLYFPQPSGDDIPHLGAFRAYFELDPTAHVREFNLNFDEHNETTGIVSTTNFTNFTNKADAAWYSLDGRKLEGKPTKKGLYIYKGRKVARQ